MLIMSCGDEGRDQGDASTSQGPPKRPVSTQKLGVRNRFSFPASEGARPAHTLISDFRPPELWDDAFLLRSRSVCAVC